MFAKLAMFRKYTHLKTNNDWSPKRNIISLFSLLECANLPAKNFLLASNIVCVRQMLRVCNGKLIISFKFRMYEYNNEIDENSPLRIAFYYFNFNFFFSNKCIKTILKYVLFLIYTEMGMQSIFLRF